MRLDWSDIPRPIIALSPMADMTDSAFCRVVKDVSKNREIMNGFGAPIVFREMISSEAILRGNNKTLDMAHIHPDERPIVQQIFGSEPSRMAEAARIIEDKHHPEGFDINMGCPVYKIVNSFNGAALMRDPKRAVKIIKMMKRSISVPLSVKIRAGWDNPRECIEFSKIIEDAGADLITLHGRTKKQGYSGQSDWNLIGEVARGVSIPLLANGDIHTPQLALEALEATGSEGVMIARGALGNPWIFTQIEDLLAGRQPQQVNLAERVAVMKKHLDYHVDLYGERGVTTFRKHVSWYFRGIRGAKPYKARAHAKTTVRQVRAILDEMLKRGLVYDGIAERDAMHPRSKERILMKK